VPTTAADPATEQVGVLITNANGVVFASLLPPGTVRKTGRNWTASIKTAKTNGGILEMKIQPTPDGSLRFNLRGYAEMSSTAMLATMSVQLPIGDDVSVATGT
jgi:hypothetical protein